MTVLTDLMPPDMPDAALTGGRWSTILLLENGDKSERVVSSTNVKGSLYLSTTHRVMRYDPFYIVSLEKTLEDQVAAMGRRRMEIEAKARALGISLDGDTPREASNYKV